MELPKIFPAFNAKMAPLKNKLMPVITKCDGLPVTCGNCNFINKPANNFCTNCGYPVHVNDDRLALYNTRLQQRKSVQRLCFSKIAQARNALYIVAGFCMFGVFNIFSGWRQSVIRGLVMVFLGIIYAALGRWSLQKPFTSLLISLMIMLTFAAINTWAEISSLFRTASGAYMLIIQAILIYFLLQGVKSAFHADVLEEEFKI